MAPLSEVQRYALQLAIESNSSEVLSRLLMAFDKDNVRSRCIFIITMTDFFQNRLHIDQRSTPQAAADLASSSHAFRRSSSTIPREEDAEDVSMTNTLIRDDFECISTDDGMMTRTAPSEATCRSQTTSTRAIAQYLAQQSDLTTGQFDSWSRFGASMSEVQANVRRFARRCRKDHQTEQDTSLLRITDALFASREAGQSTACLYDVLAAKLEDLYCRSQGSRPLRTCQDWGCRIETIPGFRGLCPLFCKDRMDYRTSLKGRNSYLRLHEILDLAGNHEDSVALLPEDAIQTLAQQSVEVDLCASITAKAIDTGIVIDRQRSFQIGRDTLFACVVASRVPLSKAEFSRLEDFYNLAIDIGDPIRIIRGLLGNVALMVLSGHDLDEAYSKVDSTTLSFVLAKTILQYGDSVRASFDKISNTVLSLKRIADIPWPTTPLRDCDDGC